MAGLAILAWAILAVSDDLLWTGSLLKTVSETGLWNYRSAARAAPCGKITKKGPATALVTSPNLNRRLRVECSGLRVRNSFRLSTLNHQLSTLPVGSTGFEPAHPFGHKALNLARLPISPRARSKQIPPNHGEYASLLATRRASSDGPRGCWQRPRESTMVKAAAKNSSRDSQSQYLDPGPQHRRKK